MKWIRGDQLNAACKKEALNAFVYRMTEESVERWPKVRRMMETGGWRMPIKTDAEWLAEHAFRVTKAGALARNNKHCVSADMGNLLNAEAAPGYVFQHSQGVTGL